MTHELYSESDNWEVENDDQDVRGWDVVDDQGRRIGTVSDMYVDTQTETIDRLVLDNGSEVDVSSVLVDDGTIRLGGMGAPGSDGSYAAGSMATTADGGYATGDAGTTSSDYVSGQRTGSAGGYGTGGASGTYGGGETGSGMGNAGTMAPGTGGTTTSRYDTTESGGSEAWRLRRPQSQQDPDTADTRAEKTYVDEPGGTDV